MEKDKNLLPDQCDVTRSGFNITCQQCGKDCETYEQVNIAMVGEEWEWWCYCKECDIETNHPC